MKICILTAGRGSRIGNLCENINKALLPIGHKAIISQIIEKFPKSDTFVIGLGYKSNQVRGYLKIAHPDRKFIFVNIKNHDGVGSGPGLSLLSCKKYLNEPFVFLPCDCNFLDEIKIESNRNWIGISKVPIHESDQYSNVLVKEGKVKKIRDKEKSPKNYYAFTGLTFIKDHKLFWRGLRSEYLIQNEHQISNGLKRLVNESELHVKKVKWKDMGTLKQFKDMQNQSDLKSIAKNNEFIYFLNNKVIKFFAEEKIIDNKITKAKIKPTFFPKIKKIDNNFYYYLYWDGDIFYDSGNPRQFKKLLKILDQNFWTPHNIKSNTMKKLCKKFYYEKTLSRIKLFFDEHTDYEYPKLVNGKSLPSLENLFKKIHWEILFDGIPCFIHGDLNFSNILYNKQTDKFLFIDWRQDFAGQISFGDLYYDLAKLYAGITMNFNHIIKKQYKYVENGNNVSLSFKKWKYHDDYLKIFHEFVSSKGLDLKKIQILSGLTYLNMAPLHPEPINRILIIFGMLMISKGLEKK